MAEDTILLLDDCGNAEDILQKKKDAQRARLKRYQIQNKEKISERKRRHYENNKEEIKRKQNEYYQVHRLDIRRKVSDKYHANKGQPLPEELRQQIRAYQRAYYAKNREKLLLALQGWRRVYYRKHRTKILAHNRRWRLRNPEKYALGGERYRARKAAAPVNDLTRAQWQEILTTYKGRCAYCGCIMKRVTMDHLTPLSKGGSHTVANVVPACQSCNSRKHDGTVLRPVQPLLLTVS